MSYLVRVELQHVLSKITPMVLRTPQAPVRFGCVVLGLPCNSDTFGVSETSSAQFEKVSLFYMSSVTVIRETLPCITPLKKPSDEGSAAAAAASSGARRAESYPRERSVT